MGKGYYTGDRAVTTNIYWERIEQRQHCTRPIFLMGGNALIYHKKEMIKYNVTMCTPEYCGHTLYAAYKGSR